MDNRTKIANTIASMTDMELTEALMGFTVADVVAENQASASKKPYGTIIVAVENDSIKLLHSYGAITSQSKNYDDNVKWMRRTGKTQNGRWEVVAVVLANRETGEVVRSTC